jgi:hypothetical protein
MTIPESWDTTMRDCIGSKTALIVHMGDSAPDLDEFTVQVRAA